MFTPIDTEMDSYENLLLWDTHEVTVHRGNDNDCEIVIHPNRIGKCKVRMAKSPYACTLHTLDGKEIYCNLDCEEDWGNVDIDSHNNVKYGNEEDGYAEIGGVTYYGTDEWIPMDEFCRDVRDFIVYYEC